MFSNETIFKTIEEMVKQYENIKDEDEFREKCIDLVYNTFNVDKYQAEVLFDMAIYNEWLYLSDTDGEIEFEIQYDKWYDHFECWLHEDNYVWRNYWTSWNFKNDTPILEILKDLDRIGQAIDILNDKCTDDEDYRKLLPLI